MQYNNATFWPILNIDTFDINSINSNFNLVEWNWNALLEQEYLISPWTSYEKATRCEDTLSLIDTLYNDGRGLLYHEGVVYAGLEVEVGKSYKRIDLYPEEAGEYGYLDVKPGSIIYTIDLSQPVNDARRYLIVDSPLKQGYNFTIVNGLMTWTWGSLDSVERVIKGPAGASNWARVVTFETIRPFGSSDLLSFRIPLDKLMSSPDTDRVPGPYDVFSVRFKTYTFEEGENTVYIPNKAWIASERDFANNIEVYYFYLVFLVTSTTSWKNLFNNSEYRLWIW